MFEKINEISDKIVTEDHLRMREKQIKGRITEEEGDSEEECLD